MKTKKWLTIILILFAVMTTGCQETEPTSTFEGVDVNIYKAGTRHIEESERFYGEIQSGRSVTITAKVGGTIETIYVENGDRVEEGETLFQLHNTEILSSVVQARSSLHVARSNLNKVKSGATDEEIGSMEQNMNSARVAYQSAKTQFERMEILYQHEAISLQQYEQAKSEMEMAEARYKSLELQFNQMKNGPSSETLEVSQAQVEQAGASYQAAMRIMEELTVISPVSGYVSNISYDEGEWVGPGTPLAVVDDLNQVYVEIQVPETIFTKLKIGQKTDVYVSSLHDTYHGVVTEVNPRAGAGSNLFRVKVSIDNPELRLKPGMTGRVSIITEEGEEVLAVPLGALIHDQGETYVYVVENGLARQRYIEIGKENDQWVEVINGLDMDDLVITRGHELVSEGEKVNVIEQSTPEDAWSEDDEYIEDIN